jgi:hypothetical protein
VFQPLSLHLLQDYYGKHFQSRSPPSLLAEVSEFPEDHDKSIVVLTQVRSRSFYICRQPRGTSELP